MQSMSTSVVTTEAVENTLQKVDDVAQELGIPLNFRTVIPDFVNSCHVSLQYYGDPPLKYTILTVPGVGITVYCPFS